MKTEIERRKAVGIADHLSLAITTFGVGYLPYAPGTYGSMVGVAIYVAAEAIARANGYSPGGTDPQVAWLHSGIFITFLLFCLVGIWAAGRSTELLGNLDPPQAVVDEVIGQLLVFLFVPFTIGWPMIVTGFLLFRLFDIWKPYPIDYLQGLPAGIGVCADDILAGVYAGVVLSVIYAMSISI